MHPVTPWLTERPLRNCSPGDLRPRLGAPAWPGQSHVEETADGPFSVFLTITDGWAALVAWMLDARYLSGVRSSVELAHLIVPPDGVDADAYAASLGAVAFELHQPRNQKALCQALVRWPQLGGVWDEAILDAAIFYVAPPFWSSFRAHRVANPPALPLQVIE